MSWLNRNIYKTHESAQQLVSSYIEIPKLNVLTSRKTERKSQDHSDDDDQSSGNMACRGQKRKNWYA